jgi:peroxiredoxin (alkyl hydroperoxide reductase subunit C)
MKKTLFFATALGLFLSQAEAQEISIPQIGVQAPEFTAQSTKGMINFPSDYGKSWKILFSHPKDFTPVCSSELLELSHAQGSFEKLNTNLVVVSTDILEQHKSWVAALEETRYLDREPVAIDFPLVADNDLKVSSLYGMVHSVSSVSQNIRGVYIVSPENIIKSIQFYPNEVGRNIEEIKRTLVALQNNHENPEQVTPANWQSGDDVIIPALSAEEKKKIGTQDSEYYQVNWFMVFKSVD